jgi:peptidoglycan/xylan/chitin deacetylase (PgdA/CDA1 family)
MRGHRAWTAGVICLAALAAAACRPSAQPPAGSAPTTPSGPAAHSVTPGPAIQSVTPGATGKPGSVPPSLHPGFSVSGTAGVVARGPADVKSVFLTFDAGSDRGFAPQILDTLRQSGVSATFGITGLWATQNRDLVGRMVAEGHALVNHTFDHRSFTGRSTHGAALTDDQRLAEIERADQAISAAAGRSPKPWFRLPYGDGDAAVGAVVRQAGYRGVLGWTVDSWGWLGKSADQIKQRCLSRVVPGAIYLFHVGSRSQDAAALPAIISELRAQGYTFQTAADLKG